MYAKRSEAIDHLDSAQPAAAAPVASGGIVADWQRMLETQFAQKPMPEHGAEVLARGMSRIAGWATLGTAYFAAGYLVFG